MMKVLFDPIDDNLPQEISDLNTNLRNWRARPRLEIRGLHESAPAVIDSLPVGEMRAVHEYPHHPEGDESWKDGSTFESPPLLENWLIQTHTYSEKEAAKTSILGGLLSAEGRQVKAGLVHEAKRFSFDKTPSFKRVEVGIAVRLSVATDSFSGKFDLTLPNLAADAQLSRKMGSTSFLVFDQGPADREADRSKIGMWFCLGAVGDGLAPYGAASRGYVVERYTLADIGGYHAFLTAASSCSWRVLTHGE